MRLPPLNALRAFEAAARHEGFTGAAEELCVTRGAISRHVKGLEEHLGVPLFRRLPQGIELTDQGRRFLPILTAAFESIGQGARSIASGKTDLRIICPPTTSIRWLIPKLAQFRAQHPEVRVRLTTEFYDWEELQGGAFDLGFCLEHFDQRPTEIESVPLFPMMIVPACAPALAAELSRPEDLATVDLLHEEPGRHDWISWLKTYPVEGVDPQSGEVFPSLDMATKAAVMGLGVVMGDVVLTRDEFESGQLVMPFPDLRCETDWGRVCLNGLRGRWSDPKVEAFTSWITEAAAKDTEEIFSRFA